MGRTARQRSTPHLPPVQKIELPSVTPKWRWALVILLLVVGVGGLVYTFVSLFSSESGWQEITATVDASELSCAGDFTLLYNLGASGVSAAAEGRAITALYTQATTDAFKLFTADYGYYDVHNVYYLNQHPNEAVEVDEALYRAFETVVRSGDRSIYLGPVYDAYNGIFSCQDDVLTADFDPYQNEPLRELFAQLAAFARDPQSVELRLLDENRVELFVSEAYLAFVQAGEMQDFVDFYWMKNAFIADYLAKVLTEGGYTFGALSSHDGFTRNLDSASGTQYALNLYDREGTVIYPAAVLRYSGARAICSLRSYPIGEDDFLRFYAFADGQIRTPYLDVQDGLCKTAADSLTVTSQTLSCAETLLRTIPVFVADTLDEGALSSLTGDGVSAIYFSDRTIVCTDATLEIGDMLSTADVQYRIEYVGK